MKKNVKILSFVIVVIAAFIFLFSFVIPKIFEWTLISDVRNASQRNEEYQQRRTELYPNITRKLELLKDGKIELSNEETKKLITIRSGLIEEPKEWLLAEFKKLSDSNDKHFQAFLEDNPENAKKIKSWIKGEIQLSNEIVEELLDSYYGYIESSIEIKSDMEQNN